MSPQTDARELFQRFDGNPIITSADFPKYGERGVQPRGY